MGHSEMLLAVAGLEEAINDRTKKLADGDWSGSGRGARGVQLRPQESKEPWSIADADVDDPRTLGRSGPST